MRDGERSGGVGNLALERTASCTSAARRKKKRENENEREVPVVPVEAMMKASAPIVEEGAVRRKEGGLHGFITDNQQC